jgi:ubiquinone/menaquinone biosynthesis C-methylase UbiE
MADESGVSSMYVFDREEGQEERRLEARARVIHPLTERLFRAAGREPGMRVLDIGSGEGDVAMLAARIVGPEGAVVGLELSEDAFASARRRVEQAGFRNVSFAGGHARNLDEALDPQGLLFDAVVGRLILQFAPDPALVFRAAADRVRPGGLVLPGV